MNTTESGAQPPDGEGVERELCRICLEPNEPGATFCKDCGAPLSSYAATGPFESILAEGHVYRQAAEHPQKVIVLLGMWLIFGFVAFVGFFVFALKSGNYESMWLRLFGLMIFGIASAILWRTTRNYFRIRSETRSISAAGD